jgi:predicted outer membrane protein
MFTPRTQSLHTLLETAMRRPWLAAALLGAVTSISLASQAADGVSSDDEKFMEKAAQGGMAEVQLGQLATQRAQRDEVKRFAQRMVTDHTAANDKLKQVTTQKGVILPADTDSSSKREYDKLQKLSAEKFDREYMSHLVSDHKKDIKEFSRKRSQAKKTRRRSPRRPCRRGKSTRIWPSPRRPRRRTSARLHPGRRHSTRDTRSGAWSAMGVST